MKPSFNFIIKKKAIKVEKKVDKHKKKFEEEEDLREEPKYIRRDVRKWKWNKVMKEGNEQRKGDKKKEIINKSEGKIKVCFFKVM